LNNAPYSADAVRDALASELRSAVTGEVRFDLHNRMLYATDASLYQVEPLGVVIPATVEDGARAVAICARAGVPVLPRGGGTSLAGQCTNRAVVVDFSMNCRAVLELDAARGFVRVEPGITIDELNDAIESTGMFFAPDPATMKHANIGGCIGNNAAGARSIRYGRTSENVLGVDVCLADGSRVRLDRGAAMRDERARELTRRVCEVVWKNRRLIRERYPRTLRRNAGYNLDLILNQIERGEGGGSAGGGNDLTNAWEERVNLAHLMCGSEGTLAVTMGAQLALHPKPGAKGLAVVGFASLDAAIECVLPILKTLPTAVELLDDTVLDLARENVECRPFVDLMPPPTRGMLKAVLYVEYFGADGAEVAAGFERLRAVTPGVAMQAHTDASQMMKAWRLRKSGEPLLHGIPGNRKPITFVEDNAVPVEHLCRFVRDMRAIVESYGTRAAFYAHASVGVLHVRPLLDIHDGADRERMRAIAVQAADLAKSLGGVMSGEHGDGRVRTPLLERFYGPELMGAFREIKRVFDPGNVLNPGNIVDLSGLDPRPIESVSQRLRVEPGVGWPVGVPEGIETYFSYNDQHGFDSAVEMCNGAGVCRKKQGGTMCPSYMATLDERHSTRGRGNALRLAITGQLSALGDGTPGGPAWTDEGTKETLNLCLSCKACKTECPSNVDVARLKAEYTAQGHRVAGGAPLPARLFGAVRTLNRLGSLLPGAANWIARHPLGRRALNRVMGLHEKRSLPAFAPSLARQWGTVIGSGGPTVALFGDCFTMFNEPSIGLATRRVLQACGYNVVLADAGCCGRAKISTGLLPGAILEADRTLERLRRFIEDPGVVAIVVGEPSCLSAFKDDWLQLKMQGSIELRQALAAKAFLPEEFVDRQWENHPRRPYFSRAPKGGRVLLHGHCHQKALWGAETSAAALRRAVGTGVEVLDSGCCGMAGSFGYTSDRYEVSMRIGELVLFPAAREAGPAARIAAPGTSCRHQLHDGTGVEARHPIEWLAEWMG